MANKLIQAKIDEMWAAWQEEPSVRGVARKCNVSTTTVIHYKKKENWQERLLAISQRAMQKADTRAVDERSKQIKIVDAGIAGWVKQLQGGVETNCPACGHAHRVTIPGLKAKYRDICELIKTRLLLSGEADSRQELVIRVERV